MEAGTKTVQITLPEMGESVTEGTVLEWLKQVGDEVEADEGIVEVSTDKVDTEVPAPAAGVLTRILVEPDETVPVGTVLGEIDPNGSAPTTAGNGGAPERAEPDWASGESAVEEAEHGADAERSYEEAKEETDDLPSEVPAATTTDAEVVDVQVPEMGESVSEGTILDWLVKVGDEVERDQGLVEVSADKVDAELPSPVAGVVTEILAAPDDVVATGTVVARIAVRTADRGPRTAGAGAPAEQAAKDAEVGQEPAPSTGNGAENATPVAA